MNINALKGLADWIAGKFGVDVVFSPEASTAWTDLRGRVIYLPTFVPDELTTALTALIDHEAEHLRISDPDTVPADVWHNEARRQYLNILEDIRINNQLALRFPAYRSLMKSFFDLLYTKPEDFTTVEGDDGVKRSITEAGRAGGMIIFEGNDMKMNYPAGWDAPFRKKEKIFRDIIDRAIKAPDLGAVLPIADELLKILHPDYDPNYKAPTLPPPPGGQGGEDEGEDEGEGEGEGEGKPGKGKKPGKEGEGEGEGKPGKGEGKGKHGKGEGEGKGKSQQEQAEEFYGKYSKMLKELDAKSGIKRKL